MALSRQRAALFPWYIGLAINRSGRHLYSTRCEAPGLAQFLVLVAVPGAYLALMYLTFRSQP